VRIERLDAGDLPRLRPLWLELHAHHQAVAPELAPFVGDDESWPVRRALYEHALAAGDRMIGVVPANTRAAALYARRGYVPTWLTLTRFGRTPETPRFRAQLST
jgi:hypothetical protein